MWSEGVGDPARRGVGPRVLTCPIWGAATVRSRISDVLTTLPARVPRDDAAALVTRYFFRVSARSLERWPVVVMVVNGRAHIEAGELFRVAQGMLDRTARVRGGRRT